MWSRIVDGQFREVLEMDGGELRYRRFQPPDASTPTEDRPATPEETERWEREREQQRRIRARRAGAQAIQRLLNHPSGIGQDLVTIFVAQGMLTPKQAINLGWTPPT